VFAGDRRVWRIAALIAAPLAALIVFFLARPVDYNTGTDSVEVHNFIAVPARVPLCVPGLLIPAETDRLRFKLRSSGSRRPALHLTLRAGGQTVSRDLPPLALRAGRVSSAVFAIPPRPSRPSASAAAPCLSADGEVGWGGTTLSSTPVLSPPTVGGAPLRARVAVWYLPRVGARKSYLSAAGAILERASLFRPSCVAPWLYAILLLLVLPVVALAAVRCLALAVSGAPPRRLALWLFAIAAVNFGCWAVTTPAFQAPDEVDHFAYAQTLVERGQIPARSADSTLRRWSTAEAMALEGVDYLTDHRSADSRPPWLGQEARQYAKRARQVRPRPDDGGGNETAALHGPLYYAALAPAYAAAGSSPFTQLTLMRLTSALIGALTVLFTFLIARELAPGRPSLGVLAALLVAYQPMYGFISGAVNNDVGLNAGAAAVELLLLMTLRRGVTVASAALLGVLLAALPVVKGTGLSLYPVALLVLLAVLWRNHRRTDLAAWGALVAGALVGALVTAGLLGGVHTSAAPAGGAATVGANASAVGGALEDIPGFLSYLWQVFLPKLPFMASHFPPSEYPAFSIFVVRGWAAFGSYTVTFPHWVYVVILLAMLSAIPLGAVAARREWPWVRRHRLELAVLILMPVAVVVGFEAAYYTPGIRPVIAEVGRYAFPAIAPIAVLVVGALHAFGRRGMLVAGTALLVLMIAFSYASQLLTLTGFYA
jgi:4-amino-4-deoxy-L-arabinose transferase-like glycosyltransferase